MMFSKTMRLFALAGLLVPMATQSMENPLSANRSVSLTQRIAQKFAQLKSKVVPLSTESKYILGGAIGFPTVVLGFLFLSEGISRLINGPSQVSTQIPLTWIAAGLSVAGACMGEMNYRDELMAERYMRALEEAVAQEARRNKLIDEQIRNWK